MGKRYGAGSGWWLEREELVEQWVDSGKGGSGWWWQGQRQWLAMAKCEEVIRVRGENIEVGREVCLRKKMNDKKEK